MRSCRPVLVWFLAFTAYFLLGAAWAFAIPVNGHTDERAHIIRAYAVADGQVLGPQTTSWNGFSGSEFWVPGNLLPPNDECLYVPQRQSAACLQPRGDDATPVLASTWTGRYSPVYYAVAGLPLRLMPGETGLTGARLVTALMSAALLATALTLAYTRRWHAVVLAVALGATPTVVGLSGAVNPNALEAAAAVLLWVCLLVLSQERVSRWPMVLGAAAGAVLLTTRTLGPLWFAIAIISAVALARASRETLAPKLAASRTMLAAWACALSGALAWNWLSGAASQQARETFQGSLAFALQTIADRRLTEWASQIVGVFGYTETYPSAILIVLWLSISAVFAARGYQQSTTPVRLLIVLLFAGIPVGLAALELAFMSAIGFGQNGRYFLPVWAGALLVAGFAARRAPLKRGYAVVLLSLLGITLVWSLAQVMTRFQRGPTWVISPLEGDWLPTLGPITPLLLACLGASMLPALYLIGNPK